MPVMVPTSALYKATIWWVWLVAASIIINYYWIVIGFLRKYFTYLYMHDGYV